MPIDFCRPNSDDMALAGSTLQHATQAALGATGGGTVLEAAEGKDGNVTDELDIKTNDGKTVEVQSARRSTSPTSRPIPDQGRSDD